MADGVLPQLPTPICQLPTPNLFMAYDANLPVDHSQIEAAELRNQFNGLKALMDAQQTQIAAQQIQIAGLQAHFPLTAPDISSDLSSSADGSIAKSAVLAAPEAWEFIATANSSLDPNVDYSSCTSLGVVAGSDDGGSAWTKHCGNGGAGPLMAARYQVGGQWSPFSGWVMAET